MFPRFLCKVSGELLGIDKIEIWEMPDRLVAEQALHADIATAPNDLSAVQTPDGTLRLSSST